MPCRLGLHALVVLLSSVVACVGSSSVECLDGRVCPVGAVCDEIHHLCVTPDQIAQCSDMLDRAPCALPEGRGACHDGVCLSAVCGNGRLDLEDEACDDGNQRDGDGCAAGCASDETCGNGVVDLVATETCDDASHLDHDGCSSICDTETPRWSKVADMDGLYDVHAVYDAARDKVVLYAESDLYEWSGMWRSISTVMPIARSRTALAYDHERRRTIMVGGTVANSPTSETWACDGATWTRLADLPIELSDHAMTYDTKRKRIVVFGGREGSQLVASTYELDVTTWTQAAPAMSPPARARAAMAYDPLRGVVVMYGGLSEANTVMNDVWEYDGQTWIPRSAGPPGLADHAMAYDTRSRQIVLVGGRDDASPANATDQVWSWNGSQWTAFVGTTPPARYGHVLVQDGNGRLLMFGGFAGVSAPPWSDTWFYDGMEWMQAEQPPPRDNFSITTLFDQGKVVTFGGTDELAYRSDTWELSSSGWKQFPDGPLADDSPPASPVPRPMTYDSARGHVVLFGSPGGRTWIREGTSWTWRQPTPSPPTRVNHALVFDAARGTTLLFGGTNGTSRFDDTWAWDGTTWTRLAPAHKPSPREQMAYGYDWSRGVVVLYGGYGDSGAPDTWIWDGTDWYDATPTMGGDQPFFGATNVLAWNPARQALVLTVSATTFPICESWEWVGAMTSPPSGTWRRIGTTVRPPSQRDGGAFSTLDGSGISLLVGRNPADSALLGELWELSWQGGASDACELPIDSDGDALTGCADPDCWRVCQPSCPPGASCSASAPRCGDGTCSSIESCHSCPIDCTGCTPVCGDFACDSGESCPGDC